MKNVQLGDKVAFNNLDDAAVFEVVKKPNEFTVGVIPEGKENHAVQYIDTCYIAAKRG